MSADTVDRCLVTAWSALTEADYTDAFEARFVDGLGRRLEETDGEAARIALADAIAKWDLLERPAQRVAGRAGRDDGARRPPPPQRFIEVSGPVTIESDGFRFARDYRGIETVDRAGTVIGWDGETEIRTPYERCVLIMPSRRLRKGESAVRFGRYVT